MMILWQVQERRRIRTWISRSVSDLGASGDLELSKNVAQSGWKYMTEVELRPTCMEATKLA